MTLNSHKQGSSKSTHRPAHEEIGDADIEWINDVITKQQDRKAPISIQALRQEMASVHKLNRGHRKGQDTLAITWHGGSRTTTSRRNNYAQSPTSKMTMDKMSREPSLPTMEDLQNNMVSKRRYSKVKDLVQDQAQPKPFTSVEPTAQRSLPTIDDLKSLMSQTGAKSKDYPKVNASYHPKVTAIENSEEHKESTKKNKKILEPKTQDRPKSRTHCKTSSLSPRHDDSKNHTRKYHEGSKMDPLRSSRHRHTARSEKDEDVTKKVSHHGSSENRSSSLGPKPRKRAGSRGRSQISSGAQSSSDRSHRKARSTSGDRRRQPANTSDAARKRRVHKGIKQEITAETKSRGHSMKTRPVVSFDQEDSEDVDQSLWMAASIMHFDDDWGKFRPKSTRPVLDANRAKKLATVDD